MIRQLFMTSRRKRAGHPIRQGVELLLVKVIKVSVRVGGRNHVCVCVCVRERERERESTVGKESVCVFRNCCYLLVCLCLKVMYTDIAVFSNISLSLSYIPSPLPSFPPSSFVSFALSPPPSLLPSLPLHFFPTISSRS